MGWSLVHGFRESISLKNFLNSKHDRDMWYSMATGCTIQILAPAMFFSTKMSPYGVTWEMSACRFLFTVRRVPPLIPSSSHSSSRAAADTNFFNPSRCVCVRPCIASSRWHPNQIAALHQHHTQTMWNARILQEQRLVGMRSTCNLCMNAVHGKTVSLSVFFCHIYLMHK